MKKKSLVVIISAVILVCSVLLGANTVFSVAKIEVSYGLVTSQAYGDAQNAQKELEKKYIGKNILFLSEKKVAAEFDGYTYLSVTKIEKKFPDKIILSVTERTEVYALEGKEIFYMTDAEGEVLRTDSVNENRADGEANFLVSGFKETNGDFSKDENFSYAMDVCTLADETLNGIRSSLLSLQVVSPTSDASDTEFVILTREGVRIHIGNPAVLAVEKMQKALERYLGLSDGERTGGNIYALDSNVSEDGISIHYVA